MTLDAAAIIAEAKARTGLNDFGGPPDVVEPFTRLVEAINREARLSDAGMAGRRAGFTRVLANRLRIAATLERHPEISAQTIRGPLVIVGLARSGTTKLQRMMAASGDFQCLPLWKMMSPIPTTAPPPGAGAEDPRIGEAETLVSAMSAAHPAFQAAHPMEAREPDEEVFLMELTFMGNLHVHGNHVPSYHAWLEGQSYDAWYAYLRTLLQLFQWQDGGSAKPWLLKAPFHLGHLELLLKYFPDATVVHCHRDPLVTTASMGGLMEASRGMFCPDPSLAEIGRTTRRVWGPLMSRYLATRPMAERTTRFVDLAYRDLIADASACIARVYEAAGVAASSSSRDRMRAWELRNAQHKHGRHAYSLERYGLERAEIDALFRDYTRRFAEFLG